jgi:uncharacterized membrane protein YdcZ (DUF606 family)
VTYAYSWFEDGVASTASTSATFSSGDTAKHHTYRVQVVASDGLVDSAFGWAEVSVINSDPVLAGPILSAGTAVVGDVLSCTATATDIDASDTPTITYAWSDGSTGATYVVSATDSVDSDIGCTATANDGDGGIVSATASATVSNTDPVMGTVTISPDPATNSDTLTCTATASDADGGSPSFGYTWSTGATGSALVLSSAIAASGDTLSCTATATDAHGGSATGSADITLSNRDPSVSVALSPAAPTKHDTVTCTAVGPSLAPAATPPVTLKDCSSVSAVVMVWSTER